MKRSGRYRRVSRTNSSSPCRTSTRWMSTSRRNTRSFIRLCLRRRIAAVVRAARAARRTGRHPRAAGRPRRGTRLLRRAARGRPFRARSTRRRCGPWCCRATAEVEQAARDAAELVRSGIAEQGGELFLGIGAQQLAELLEALREFGIAADAHGAALDHCVRRRAGKRHQVHRGAFDFGIAGRMSRRLRRSELPSDSTTTRTPMPLTRMPKRFPARSAHSSRAAGDARKVTVQQVFDRFGEHRIDRRRSVAPATMHRDDTACKVVVAASRRSRRRRTSRAAFPGRDGGEWTRPDSDSFLNPPRRPCP
jgi:hypothetical protein